MAVTAAGAGVATLPVGTHLCFGAGDLPLNRPSAFAVPRLAVLGLSVLEVALAALGSTDAARPRESALWMRSWTGLYWSARTKLAGRRETLLVGAWEGSRDCDRDPAALAAFADARLAERALALFSRKQRNVSEAFITSPFGLAASRCGNSAT